MSMRGQRERRQSAGRRRRAHTPAGLRLPPGPSCWSRVAEVAAPDGGGPGRARTPPGLEVLPVGAGRHAIAVMLRRAAAAGLAAACASFASGCYFFHRPRPQPPTLVINQPIVLSTEPVLNVPAPAPAPPPPAPAPAKPAAARVERPRHASRARADREEKEAATAPPPLVNTADMPQLTPQLSPAESEARRRATTEWLDAAQHDLALVAARSLTPAQQANRSQADEFIRQARQALAQGDVVRAQNLAHKALVIAEAILESAG